MEISVKQRLVGAVVIVAAAVIFLPMIFDGPPPDQTVTHTVPLPLPSSKQAVQVDIDSGKTVSSAPASEQHTSAPVAQTPQKTASAPVTKPQATAASAQAKATVKTPDFVESPLASKQGWAVQAGSFADPQHAQILVDRLKAKKLSAFVQRYKAAGRTLYRVRVGPYPERVDAERQAPAVAAAAGGPTKVVPNP